MNIFERMDREREAERIAAEPDVVILLDLIRRGVLIGVEVFGENDCCEHGENADCHASGFGLCDVFGPKSVGSDCNRAEMFLMRPSDAAMTDAVKAALTNESTHD